MGETVSTRISSEDSAEIKHIGKKEQLDRSAVVRRLLSRAIMDWKVEEALKHYREKKITIGKVAEQIGMPLREALALAAAKGIPFQYSARELREDLREALK